MRSSVCVLQLVSVGLGLVDLRVQVLVLFYDFLFFIGFFGGILFIFKFQVKIGGRCSKILFGNKFNKYNAQVG